MLEESGKGVRVVISGRVQGVWFRGWTVDEATARGLSGWVRNRRDGTVEAVFEGAPAAVDAMIEACRSGPPPAPDWLRWFQGSRSLGTPGHRKRISLCQALAHGLFKAP